MPERRGRYKECRQCGGIFWVTPSEERQRARKYCGKACYSEAQTKPANAECDVCGAAYKMAPHEVGRNRTACSMACASKKQETRPKARECRWCGKGFESVSRNRNFCSSGCRINQSWKTYHDRIDASPGLVSKRTAQSDGETYFRDGRSCKYGHDSLKYVSNNACVECTYGQSQVWRIRNLEKAKRLKREKYWQDPKAQRERSRSDYYANLGERRAASRKRAKQWREQNLPKYNAMQATIRASKRKATPPFADQRYITLFYELAALESKRIGEPVEVDHIVPINHSLVCGLHYEHNLQLLTATDNRAKSNHWWPGMPEERDAS